MWRPNSLLEATEPVAIARDRHGRYICPNCRVHRHAAVIVDVRRLPIPEDWACDACWTKWAREARIVDGGPPVTDERDWTRRWLIAHGAPAELVDRHV